MAIGDYTHNIGAIEGDAKNQKADLKLSEKVAEDWRKPMTDLSTRLADRLRHDKRIGQGARECRHSAVRAGHREQSGQGRHEFRRCPAGIERPHEIPGQTFGTGEERPRPAHQEWIATEVSAHERS